MNSKLKFLIYITAFGYGALLMYFEVLSAKIIIPFYGASLKVWASVFNGVLMGLSVGYYLGGLMKDRYFPALCSLTASIFIFTIPFVSVSYMESLYAFGHNSGLLLTSLFICFIPSVAFGALSPSLVNLLCRTHEETGQLAGRIFCISTVGGVIMAIVSGFWLIPYIGIANSCLIIGIAMAFVSLLFSISFNEKKMIRFALICLSLMSLSGSYYAITADSPDFIKYKKSGFYGELIVADVNYNDDDKVFKGRALLNNRIAQSLVDMETGVSVWRYIHYLSALSSIKQSGSKALMLGLAGGSLARELIEMGINVEAVDIDPRVYEVAKEFFDLSPKCKFIVDDARHFLNVSNSTYDVIIIDLFAAESQPFHVFTLEAFQRMMQLLNDDGLVLINFHESLSGKEGRGFRSVYKTMLKSGYHVGYVSTARFEGEERNNILIGKKGGPLWKNPPILKRETYKKMGINLPMEIHQIAEEGLLMDFILTDNRPIFEVINEEAFRGWREHAIRNYLIGFRMMGIPFF